MSTQDAIGMDMERHGSVVVLAFNRPERRNSLDMDSRRVFAQMVSDAVADDSVRAIVLTGRGGHFCAGGDITSMGAGGLTAEAGRTRMRNTLKNVETLYTCDKPVIAAVEGCAFGGGFGLALLADIIIASETARFCMSFAKVGLLPDSASLYTLPRIVGVQRAKALLMSAREVRAQEALDLGIAMEVVPKEGALPRALEIAQALAKASPVATAMTKTALNNSLSSDLRSMIEYEATAQGVAFSSDFHVAAVQDFLAKRPGSFQWPEARA